MMVGEPVILWVRTSRVHVVHSINFIMVVYISDNKPLS